jgi:hypothetical protein
LTEFYGDDGLGVIRNATEVAVLRLDSVERTPGMSRNPHYAFGYRIVGKYVTNAPDDVAELRDATLGAANYSALALLIPTFAMPDKSV